MIEKLKDLPPELGQTERLLADNGYLSAANVEGCEAAGIEPLIALGREAHHASLQRFAAAAEPPSPNATPMQKMARALRQAASMKLSSMKLS
jgi:hypothetical protein